MVHELIYVFGGSNVPDVSHQAETLMQSLRNSGLIAVKLNQRKH